jgi:hypothetical protein
MTERTWAPVGDDDLVEQGSDVEPAPVAEIDAAEAAWESNLADALEQRVEIGYDDERDPQG